MNKLLKKSLQFKILLGYLILLAVIISMTAILFCEQERVKEINTEMSKVRRVRGNINTVHLLIFELFTLGESIIAWNDSDLKRYKKKQEQVDVFLNGMKQDCLGFISSNQIDSLRNMLQEKEVHLFHIMTLLQRKKNVDSLFIEKLPKVAEEASKIRTIERKKNGFLGKILGRKETIYLPSSSNKIYALRDEMSTKRHKYICDIDVYTDSLKIQNKALNLKLTSFVTCLDNQAQEIFKRREEKIFRAHNKSNFVFFTVVITTIVLQLISFFIIRIELKKEEKRKYKLKQVIKENEHILQMRKKIILTVSHDIRGPLGNISNCAELASDTKDKRKRETYLENIRYSCRHILHLVNDLMDVYRMNEAKDIRNDVPFYLDKMIKRISDDYSKKSNKKALIFNSRHKNINIVVKGDSDKIEQVLNNILTNAIKFTEYGHIDFTSEYSEGKLSITITDTGIGMDSETLNRVFQPFERAAQHINSEGFGLGLFITKGLVNVLNGDMHVESVPGKGTKFHICFPLEESSEKVDSEEGQYCQNYILPKKIIVVDDDVLQLKIVEDMLGRNGILCKPCTNAKEVVNALHDSVYDLILTDIQMRNIDGFSLLKLLRDSDIGNSKAIPIAAMTARGDGDSGIYIRSGFCGYIHKPFSMKNLLFFLSSIMTDNIQLDNNFNYTLLLDTIEDRREAFKLLIEESKKDLIELKKALDVLDCDAMRQVIHRMLPVWELLKNRDILEKFRSCLNDKEIDADTIRNHAIFVINRIELLISESKDKLIKYDKENINIRG